MHLRPAQTIKQIAVVGAGPAGLAAATTAARRGHKVTLFEAADQIGGQFNIAKQIPGKEEFYETLRYFKKEIELSGVTVNLNHRVTAAALTAFDEIILATGVIPRRPDIPGIDHPKVLGYLDVIAGAPVGPRVAVIGAGGIGFDISEYLIHSGPSASQDIETFMKEWGIDMSFQARGGVEGMVPQISPAAREVFLLQRKSKKVGAGLGKTTGWIHRTNLAKRGVQMMAGVTYEKIDDAGLHITQAGTARLLQVDSIVLCAGQEPERSLAADLPQAHLIGGADVAAELDARRAIDQGTRLAARL